MCQHITRKYKMRITSIFQIHIMKAFESNVFGYRSIMRLPKKNLTVVLLSTIQKESKKNNSEINVSVNVSVKKDQLCHAFSA